MTKIEDVVRIHYRCDICNESHEIKLEKKIFTRHSKFPFPYIFLHGELRNLLTTLYLDKDFQIRAVEIHELSDDDLFSKEHVLSITKTLMIEIEKLRKENRNLIEKLKNLREEEISF